MIWNKLRFLFTGKLTLWELQEQCPRDYSDCHECGSGLYHYSNEYLTFEEADYWARDYVQQQRDFDDPNAKVVAINDDGRWCYTLVREDGSEYDNWCEVYRMELERSKEVR